MANTEGMSDEFVESLMTTDVSEPSSKRSARRKGTPISSRLQERLNAPLEGGRPAAKIIRASPQSRQRSEDPPSASSASVSTEQDEAQPQSMFSSLIVGEVVERSAPSQAKNRISNARQKRASRFKQQQQNQQQTAGFPSVHMPLGTFVNKKPSRINKQKIRMPTPIIKDVSKQSEPSIREASQRDARNMLAEMSVEEIKQHQRELEAALSPDIKEFLKRGKAASKDTNAPTVAEPTTVNHEPTVRSLPTINETSRQEKERLARLMTSVQTHLDLDVAYQEEMNRSHPLEHETPSADSTADFALACDLLRSSVKRQTLWAARAVSQTLNERVHSTQKQRDWPLLLPISLRCLLDEPFTGNGILHTYILQSIYSLLLLNAIDDHVVWVNGKVITDSHIFQESFMEDAIPTPPLDTAYPSNTIQPLAVDNAVAAYSTSSSSTSAEEDGKAFEKDPMWTLLSTMRIIPRLVQLLKHDLPEEAWVASCGILCMLSQRSPGAASAIVHHNTLLPRVLDRCLTRHALERQQEHHKMDARSLLEQVAFASMQLLVTLARQSRVTAKAIVPHLEEILPPLLLPSNRTLSSLELRLQKMAIVLWRSLLRYGLGLAGFATVLKMAAHHWALPYSHPNSLSTEYLSAVAQVLDCARIAQTAPTSKSNPIDGESMTILSMAAAHLAPTRRQLLPLAPAAVEALENNEPFDYRWNAARLRFLTAFWSLSDPEASANQEIKTEDLPMEEELICLEALDAWADPGGKVEAAWAIVSRRLFKESTIVESSHGEAAASAFLTSFASLLLTLESSSSKQKNILVSQLTRAVVAHFVERILFGLRLLEGPKGSEFKQDSKISLPRQGWTNQCSFAVAKLLCHAHTIGVVTTASDINLARLLVFSLLGNLERGNESIAVVLFSQDFLFTPIGNPLQGAFSGSSALSSMFLGELCGSERARKQLDHSFKLQHGFGITSAGYGSFALDSLLSDADQAGPRSSSGDLLLPLGRLWLWQTLSGFIRMSHQAVESGTSEATNVVSTVLGVLLELEEGDRPNMPSGYGSHIPLGTKLYYLMNVCLHPEVLLRDERVTELAEALLERYCSQLQFSSLPEFSKACFQHTEPAKKSIQQGEDDQPLGEKEQKLLDALLHPDSGSNTSLPAGEIRALEALLEDLVAAYRDFGAQYSFFTKCMRQFLSPIFPSSIRSSTLRELRGILHLLTLPEENENDFMSTLTARFVHGGLPVKDQSTREPAELLDAVAMALQHECSSRPADGFFLYFSVATLARSVAISVANDVALKAAERRLNQLDGHMASLICSVGSDFLKSDASKQSLIEATVRLSGSISPACNDDSKTVFDLHETLKRMAQP